LDVIEALHKRYTSRAFTSKSIVQETLLKVLEDAIHSPSWANSQPWEVFIATGEPLQRIKESFLNHFKNGVERHPELPTPQSWPPVIQQRIMELGAKRFEMMGIQRDNQTARQEMTELNFNFFNAPVVIYLCLERSLTPWSIFDLGALSQSIMLAGQHYGLDTAPAYNLIAYPKLIRKELEIPEDLLILMGIAIGYGDNQHPVNQFRSPRRLVNEVVRMKGF
jgi:nitroreductase